MNREQAKIIGKMSDEQLRAVSRTKWITNRKFIIAFGEGETILLDGSRFGTANESLEFNNLSQWYSIHKPTQMINGIECPMYLTKLPEHWTIPIYLESIEATDFYNVRVRRVHPNDLYINRKIAHLTKEAAIKCCKARYGMKD